MGVYTNLKQQLQGSQRSKLKLVSRAMYSSSPKTQANTQDCESFHRVARTGTSSDVRIVNSKAVVKRRIKNTKAEQVDGINAPVDTANDWS